jgi:hypothetical protein
VSDASTLDGINSTQFLRSDTSDSFTSGTPTINSPATLDVAGQLKANRLTDRGNPAYYVDPEGNSVFAQVYINGLLFYLNQSGPDSPFTFCFYDYGSPIDEFFLWNAAADRFQFSNDVRTDNIMYAWQFRVTSGSDHFLMPGSFSTLHGLNLTHYWLNINSDGPDGPGYIYFYDHGSQFGEYL